MFRHSFRSNFRFKTLVGKYGPQYQGSEQHDAQEFLIWLLDKVHEDLNRANKTKYKKLDSKVSDESGSGYSLRSGRCSPEGPAFQRQVETLN